MAFGCDIINTTMTIRDLSALIKTAKGPLSNDPQSGGILKVLAAAGFSEKIMNGSDAGRTYQVLHAPGERNFVVMEKWVEKDGTNRTMYYPFVITEDLNSKKQDTSTKIQTSDTTTDVFSRALDSFEHSLDEFLSFAKA